MRSSCIFLFVLISTLFGFSSHAQIRLFTQTTPNLDLVKELGKEVKQVSLFKVDHLKLQELNQKSPEQIRLEIRLPNGSVVFLDMAKVEVEGRSFNKALRPRRRGRAGASLTTRTLP